jgi:hypothetical protein
VWSSVQAYTGISSIGVVPMYPGTRQEGHSSLQFLHLGHCHSCRMVEQQYTGLLSGTTTRMLSHQAVRSCFFQACLQALRVQFQSNMEVND